MCMQKEQIGEEEKESKAAFTDRETLLVILWGKLQGGQKHIVASTNFFMDVRNVCNIEAKELTSSIVQYN